MQLQGPGIEHLVQLLLQDGPFSKAVQQQDTNAAASAAVGVVKSHLKAFSAALRPPGSISTGGHAAAGGGDSDSPVFRRIASEQQRRSSDTGAGTFRPDIRLKDRVVINTNQKKYDGNLVGKEGTVLQITSNGWVKLQVGNETLDIQMRYLTLVHPRGGTSSLVTSQSLPVGPAGTKVLGLDGKAGAVKGSRGIPRKSEVVKQVRKELTQLEEQVPWKEVQDRWRTHRKTWTRRLRQADTTRDMAICIREFHDHLKTDKATGLFAVGGSWELMLRECITGSGNHLQLLQVWEDMRSALQAWLAEGELPGGLASLDKSSYEQAVCTYQVLQEAASRGPEYLEQVGQGDGVAAANSMQILKWPIVKLQACRQRSEVAGSLQPCVR
eukprot:GHRR01022661.1.p1 GENE.GHRR01022661.1~~GHRR01022661.1.p1  ORF type:complete len:383 (+),score=125.01 GHRR01022661.1:288-1436(+)